MPNKLHEAAQEVQEYKAGKIEDFNIVFRLIFHFKNYASMSFFESQ